jgi:hypothetical protein
MEASPEEEDKLVAIAMSWIYSQVLITMKEIRGAEDLEGINHLVLGVVACVFI